MAVICKIQFYLFHWWFLNFVNQLPTLINIEILYKNTDSLEKSEVWKHYT